MKLPPPFSSNKLEFYERLGKDELEADEKSTCSTTQSSKSWRWKILILTITTLVAALFGFFLGQRVGPQGDDQWLGRTVIKPVIMTLY